MRPFVLAVALVAILALQSAVATTTCTVPTSTPTLQVDRLTESGVTLGSGVSRSATYYLFMDDCDGDCLPLPFIYQETNGVKGLQRQDYARDDTCGGFVPADWNIF